MPDSSSAAPARAHQKLLGFRTVRRRTLAAATLSLSMLLVVMHELPASASTLPVAEPVVEGQQLALSEATLAAAAAVTPVTESRDAFDIELYTPVQWPVNPASPLTSTFGYRYAPCGGCSTMHSGVDWTPGIGTPIEAIADGVVVSRPMDGWGSYVVIQHMIDGQVVYSGYAHMISGSNAPVGTVVRRGDVIGRVGDTGASTAPHLHFSIFIGERTFIDPYAWLQAKVTEPWD